MTPTLKHPSAWFPIFLSVAVFVMLLMSLSISGGAPQADEGLAVHLFQLWLVIEIVLMAVFAHKWLHKSPKQASKILALQVIVALVPILVVLFGHL